MKSGDKELTREELREKFERRSSGAKFATDIFRALFCYFSALVICSVLFVTFSLVFESITEGAVGVPRPIYAVASLAVPFAFFSVFRLGELYDREAQLEFSEDERWNGFFAELSRICKNSVLRRKLIVKLSVALLLSLLLPWRFGFASLGVALFDNHTAVGAEVGVAVKAIVCPLFLLILPLSVSAAHKWWLLGAEDSRIRILTCRHYNIRMLLELVKVFAIYGVGFYILPSVAMLLFSLLLTLKLFRGTGVWIALGAIVLFVFAVRYFSALGRRRKFLRRLRRLAAEEGWTLSRVRSPYLSLLVSHLGESFTLEKNGKSYACKLLASINRRHPTYIDLEGSVTTKITVQLFGIEIFHYLVNTRYAFEAQGVKLVIFSPESKRLFINRGRSDVAPDSFDTRAKRPASAKHSQSFLLKRSVISRFETGDRVGEYKLFTEEGFLSAMDNDCLDRNN